MKSFAVSTLIVCVVGQQVHAQYFQPKQGDLYADESSPKHYGAGSGRNYGQSHSKYGTNKYGGVSKYGQNNYGNNGGIGGKFNCDIL